MKETIAAIATGMSNSGIGIVRISGEEAIDIIDKIFVPKKTNKKMADVKSHTIHYGKIIFNDNVIDEVLVMIMKCGILGKDQLVITSCLQKLLLLQKKCKKVVLLQNNSGERFLSLFTIWSILGILWKLLNWLIQMEKQKSFWQL